MTDEERQDYRRVPRLSRRRLLALVGVGVSGSVAGCGNSGGGSTDTPADAADEGDGSGSSPTASNADGSDVPTPRKTAATTPAATGTRTVTDTPTPTATDTPTSTATDTPTPTATDTPVSVDVPEGGSYVAPGDGFADVAPWLDGETAVTTVAEPTREALEDAVNRPGPNVVVFETSGTIDLGAERFNVAHDRTWIAGQTAPSPGITLVRGGFQIAANDCVVQHLRVRPGDADRPVGEGWEPDSITTEDGTRNSVFDHVSATWSVDEVASPGYNTHNTTVANCIVAEALVDATHHKGEHGYGSLVGDGATNVAMLGNVFAHNTARNPRLKAGTESAVVNNVMYHFDEATNLDNSTLASIVGNVYKRVDADDANVQGSKAFLEDNVSIPETQMTDGVDRYAGRPVWPPHLAAMDSGEVLDHNLTYAGARPADRTDNDVRILESVRTDTGSYVDSQTEVGGYPDLAENTHSLSVPSGALRNWLAAWAVAVEEPGVSPPQ